LRSLEIFDLAESQAVLEYFVSTFFAHFKAYKYSLAPLAELDLTLNYNGVSWLWSIVIVVVFRYM
jgi:hypothetical protein